MTKDVISDIVMLCSNATWCYAHPRTTRMTVMQAKLTSRSMRVRLRMSRRRLLWVVSWMLLGARIVSWKHESAYPKRRKTIVPILHISSHTLCRLFIFWLYFCPDWCAVTPPLHHLRWHRQMRQSRKPLASRKDTIARQDIGGCKVYGFWALADFFVGL